MYRVHDPIINAIDNIVNFAVIYGILAMLMYSIRNEAADLWWFLLLAIPFAANFFLRRYVKNFWLLLAAHCIFPVLIIVLVHGILFQVVWMIAAIVITFYSLAHYYKRGASAGSGVVYIYAGLFIIFTFWATGASHFALAAIYPPIIVIIAIGHVLIWRMRAIDSSLEGILHSQPVERTLTFNYKLMCWLGAAMAGLALLTYFAANFRLFAGLYRLARVIFIYAIMPLIIFIARLLGTNEPPQPEHVNMELGYGVNYERPPVPIEPEEELDDIYSTLSDSVHETVIIIILAVLLAAFIGSLIFLIVKNFLIFLAKRAEQELETGSVGAEKRVFILQANNESKLRGISALREDPVRRKYKKAVSRHIKLGADVKPSHTPAEVAGNIAVDDINDLVEEYADVRYS